MPHHEWGDETFDWDGFGKAVDEFTHMIRFYGKWTVHSKEKWGCMRLDFFYPVHDAHSFWKPGHLYIRWPRQLYRLDLWLTRYILEPIGYVRLMRKYQRLVFNLATIAIIRKYPQFHDELLWESYFDDLLYDWVKEKVKYVCNWS